MKKMILLLLIAIAMHNSYSQEDYYYNDFINPVVDTLPNYLKPWWGNTRISYVAVVYLDFPDGRYNDNGVLKQPYTNEQLASVLHPDASGEAGVIKTNGVFSLQALKYDWYDRWNMFFDTLGAYNGTAHPDFLSHGDSAYGSMREYWKDASDNHFLMKPYPTHPYETDYKLKYGIINEFETVGGRVIIKNFMMPKNKYGSDNSNSYFRSFEDVDNLVNKGTRLLNEADSLVRIYYANSFDWTDFTAKGGIVIYVMSGSSFGLKGLGIGKSTLVRGRFKEITNLDSTRIDGISITAHEFAHLSLGWNHTSASRYCIMNAHDKHNKDCPQLPNPVLRMREGWINPIEIRGTQSITNLPPIETSKQCGVITIYGKPSAKPDWTCGESFIVENRKQIGFDRKILEKNNSENKPGGLLIWHYSPYHDFQPAFDDHGWDLSYELIPANGATGIYGSYGDPEHFFAYKENADYIPFKKLVESRTHSSLNLNTGIVIDNIEQNNYYEINSTIRFDLQYTIAEPPNYTYVIQSDNNASTVINLHDTVYFHSPQPLTGFSLAAGTVFESFPYSHQINGIKARGTFTNPVTFRGIGYGIHRADFLELCVNNNTLLDSTIFDNCKFIKSQLPVTLSYYSYDPNKPLILNNVEIDGDDSEIKLVSGEQQQSGMNISTFAGNVYKTLRMKGYFLFGMNDNLLIPAGSILRIEDKGEVIGNSTFNFQNQKKLVLNGNCFLSSMLTINADIDVGSSGLLSIFTSLNNAPKIYFAPNTGINCSGELNFNSSNNYKVELLVDSNIDTCYWSGIKCENPQNILIDSTIIKKAKTGFSATDYISNIVIQNSVFQNNLFTDIKLDNSLTSDQANADINHCIFTGNSNLLSSIVTDDILNVQISYNQFNDIYSNGVSLLYTVNPILTNNNFLGTTGNVSGVYTGIYSYSSAGFYGCNTATNFYDGILLDNSSPYMLNNELWNNGYGLYLTNNSIPVMSPSYSQNQALFNAGYNKIYNNLSDEIFCNNAGTYQLSYPYLTKGYNSIYDSAGSEYLLNLNYLFDPPLDVTENFWGGESAYIYDKINPQGSTVYDPYLGSPSISSNCSPYV